MSQEQKKRPNIMSAGVVPTNVGQTMSAPSPNIIQKILGDNLISSGLKNKYPEIEGAFMGRQIEMPREANAVTRISEMGPWGRMMSPNAYASTGPFGNIALNMDMIKQDKQDVNDVLAHEMTHARQGMMGHIKSLFGSRAPEDEAINKESMRKVRRTDIQLR